MATYRMLCETCGNAGDTESQQLAKDLVALHNKQYHDGEPVAEMRRVVDGEERDAQS